MYFDMMIGVRSVRSQSFHPAPGGSLKLTTIIRKKDMNGMTRKRRTRRKKKRNFHFAFLFVGFFIGFAILFVFNIPFRDQIFKRVMGVDVPENAIILAVGLDGINPVRSDTIILLTLNIEAGEVFAFSIPRDTRLYVPDRGYDKANHAYAWGGIPLLKTSLENALHIEIPYYIEADFDGFAQLVDILGGVNIDIEKDMYYVDRAQDLVIDLTAGRQRIDGDMALQYVRFRSDRLGDIGRIERQQNFIQALIKELESPTRLPYIPQIVNEMREAVHTNLPSEDIISLALWYKGLDNTALSLMTLPGQATYLDGVSYWEPELDEGRSIIEEFFTREKESNDHERNH